MPLIMAFVLALSFVLLLVAFRSIVIPIKAILLNLLSTGAAFGLMVLVFQQGFLADVLDVAGGENVFGDVKKQAVQATTEMILTRRPEVIIELRYGDRARAFDPARDLRAWSTLGSVPAVRTKRIHVLVGDQFVVPGPRIVQAARQLGHILHAEARW